MCSYSYLLSISSIVLITFPDNVGSVEQCEQWHSNIEIWLLFTSKHENADKIEDTLSTKDDGKVAIQAFNGVAKKSGTLVQLILCNACWRANKF